MFVIVVKFESITLCVFSLCTVLLWIILLVCYVFIDTPIVDAQFRYEEGGGGVMWKDNVAYPSKNVIIGCVLENTIGKV